MTDTTPRPDPAVALRPRRAGDILGAALDLYLRHPGPLIALVAVWLLPMGALNWRADCSRTRPGPPSWRAGAGRRPCPAPGR